MIKTFEDAYTFVREVKVCTIFASAKVEHPSLWQHVDLPDKKPGEKGWGQKMEAVWSWKNRLPAIYPNDIYYGKIKGGFAVLMDMDYLRDEHFPKAHKPVEQLNWLAQRIYEKIRMDPWDTTSLRQEVLGEFDVSKNQFDTALKNLQISLNIVRVNDLNIEQDTWVTFQESYLEIWNKYHSG
jgi:hypothetical protein